MFSQLIDKAVVKAGNKSALARVINEQRPRVVEYASLTRTPTDVFILKIADYLNLDKGETLYKAKLELDPENAELWKWCARRESNPRPSASEAAFIIVFRYILSLSQVFASVAQPYRHRLNQVTD